MNSKMVIVLGLAFLIGITVGSFLNVCIFRIPNGQSIVRPRSRCPVCGTAIPWYLNVPILSYIMLLGRCAACHVKIPLRYPAVEFLTGVLFLMGLRWFGLTPFLPVLWLFFAVLIVVTFIDLDCQIIPDVISLPGIVVFFAASFIVPWVSPVDAALGILVGGGSLYLIALGYELLTKNEGMGGGDIKLLAMIGAFLGWKSILPIVLFASLIGTVVGVPTMLLQKKNMRYALPFGPFLSVGALLYIFWGGPIIRWYLSLFV